eukprot:11198035-Lingulodinium_polyedra.AAC.1
MRPWECGPQAAGRCQTSGRRPARWASPTGSAGRGARNRGRPPSPRIEIRRRPKDCRGWI